MISKSSITAYNNETVNRLSLSRVKILKSVLGQGNDNNNNLDKFKKLILFKIQQLKKKKKKTIYRIRFTTFVITIVL